MDLQPFFDLEPSRRRPRQWLATPGVYAMNQMGGVHGGAICLLATEVAVSEMASQAGCRLEPLSICISFLQPIRGAISVIASAHNHDGAGSVSVQLRSAETVCAAGFVIGRCASGDPPSPRKDSRRTPVRRPDGLVASTVPFRDAMGVRVSQLRASSLSAQWTPSEEQWEFAVTGRALAIASLLVDAGGTIVNSTHDGMLDQRYVTTCLAASLIGPGLEAVLGPARLEEPRTGKSIRSVHATLTDSNGTISGHGLAQFALTARTQPQ
jgi:acyl-coenzyme A thioesterase PaaI-like protein